MIGSILVVILVVALAVIIASIVFGVIVIQPKSAYIPPRLEVVNASGQQVISLFLRGGDRAALWQEVAGDYVLSIHLDTPGGSFAVTPDTGVETFNPGETLFIYNSSSGLRAAYNLTG